MLNRVQLIGRIATEPHLEKGETYTRKPFDVCLFTFAFNRTGISRKGTGKTQPTNYIKCCVYGGLIKVIMEHCSKGMKLLLEGELVTSYYKNGNGGYNYNSNINVNRIYFLEGKNYKSESMMVGNEEIYLPSYGDEDFVLGDERIYEVKDETEVTE